jgi:hypothetical protein
MADVQWDNLSPTDASMKKNREKRIIWLLALAPLIIGIGQLGLQQSSLTLLILRGGRPQPKQITAALANSDAQFLCEVRGDLVCSTALTSMCVLWAALAYRVMSKRYGDVERNRPDERPVMTA